MGRFILILREKIEKHEIIYKIIACMYFVCRVFSPASSRTFA